MQYTHEIIVRYGETDQMGVVHHANYLLYFEEARTRFLASLGQPYGELEKQGIALPVRKVEMRFRSPALYEDRIAVKVEVDRVTPASIRFAYRITRAVDDTLLATGTTELACMDMHAKPRKAILLPKELAAMFRSDKGE